MATTAHCIFCFENLVASLEQRKPLSLNRVEELWARYEDRGDEQRRADGQDDDGKAIAPNESEGFQDASPASGTSTLSILSGSSASSSSSALNDRSKSSSKSSLFSFSKKTPKEEEHPVYVTWNTLSSRGHKSLRGCIGTFEPQPLSEGLKDYALISAFQDHRFNQIVLRELPSLSSTVTLLLNFTPCADAMDWTLGRHGLRIHFTYKGRRYGATYLPDVAAEQGWTKEETIISLMKKAGWTGRERDWRNVDLNVVKYEGLRADVDWAEYKGWRDWVDKEGLA